MRNMSSPAFCAPCIEGMWHQFMMRMSLIDGVDISYEGDDARVSLLVVPLGQFREEPIPGIVDRYTVSYWRDGVAQPQFDDMFVFDVGPSLSGQWTAEVRATLQRTALGHADVSGVRCSNLCLHDPRDRWCTRPLKCVTIRTTCSPSRTTSSLKILTSKLLSVRV